MMMSVIEQKFKKNVKELKLKPSVDDLGDLFNYMFNKPGSCFKSS